MFVCEYIRTLVCVHICLCTQTAATSDCNEFGACLELCTVDGKFTYYDYYNDYYVMSALATAINSQFFSFSLASTELHVHRHTSGLGSADRRLPVSTYERNTMVARSLSVPKRAPARYYLSAGRIRRKNMYTLVQTDRAYFHSVEYVREHLHLAGGSSKYGSYFWRYLLQIYFVFRHRRQKNFVLV